MKPTCLIQLTPRFLAIAVGSLKEDSSIEIHDVNKGKLVSSLAGHHDMIDSLLKLNFPQPSPKLSKQPPHLASIPYISWLLSAGRDRQIILWKLFDGKNMRRKKQFNPASMILSNSQQSEEEKEEGDREEVNNRSLAGELKDYFYSLQTSHKDFIRSMVQLQPQTLLSASEDKTIKIFTISF